MMWINFKRGIRYAQFFLRNWPVLSPGNLIKCRLLYGLRWDCCVTRHNNGKAAGKTGKETDRL
jgi:hypothetical protein